MTTVNARRYEILLRSGHYFDYTDATTWRFDIEDIAHSLSMQCRFNGHANRFFSVAQHSVLVSHLVPQEHAFNGLMHDAAEAYLGDVVRGLKQLLPDYKRLEMAVEKAIARRFGLTWPMSDEVERGDRLSLAIERRDLMPPMDDQWARIAEFQHLLDEYEPIKCLWPHEAEYLFMVRFRETCPRHLLEL